MKIPDNINNKGFVLAETLAVAVAIATIFTITFNYFYPLMGEYERREDYDDLDSKYGTYWIKKLIQDGDYNLAGVGDDINNNGYAQFKCSNVTNVTKQKACYQMMRSLEVSCGVNVSSDPSESTVNICNQDSDYPLPHVYITSFDLSNAKQAMKSSSNFSQNFKDYLDYLPDYSHSNVNLNNANYRIIIEYYRHRFDTPYVKDDNTKYIFDDQNDYYTYSTIEVK